MTPKFTLQPKAKTCNMHLEGGWDLELEVNAIRGTRDKLLLLLRVNLRSALRQRFVLLLQVNLRGLVQQ
jgi:hypothetical protein